MGSTFWILPGVWVVHTLKPKPQVYDLHPESWLAATPQQKP